MSNAVFLLTAVALHCINVWHFLAYFRFLINFSSVVPSHSEFHILKTVFLPAPVHTINYSPVLSCLYTPSFRLTSVCMPFYFTLIYFQDHARSFAHTCNHTLVCSIPNEWISNIRLQFKVCTHVWLHHDSSRTRSHSTHVSNSVRPILGDDYTRATSVRCVAVALSFFVSNPVLSVYIRVRRLFQLAAMTCKLCLHTIANISLIIAI